MLTAFATAFASASSCANASPANPLLEIIAADNREDLAGVMALYTADPIWLPLGRPAVKGAASIRQSYVEMYRDFSPRLTISIDKVSVDAGLAVVSGETGGSLVPSGGGPPKFISDAFEARLLCDQGSWKVSVLRWWPASRAD